MAGPRRGVLIYACLRQVIRSIGRMLDTILVMLLVVAALCVTIITADEIRRLLSRLWHLR